MYMFFFHIRKRLMTTSQVVQWLQSLFLHFNQIFKLDFLAMILV